MQLIAHTSTSNWLRMVASGLVDPTHSNLELYVCWDELEVTWFLDEVDPENRIVRGPTQRVKPELTLRIPRSQGDWTWSFQPGGNFIYHTLRWYRSITLHLRQARRQAIEALQQTSTNQ